MITATYIYIYIYMYRERERETYTYNIHIHLCGNFAAILSPKRPKQIKHDATFTSKY